MIYFCRLVSHSNFKFRFLGYNTMVIMTKDFISEIKELNNSKVYIKDKANVNKLINEIVGGGKNKLQFILDFDRTITKQHVNDKRQPSSFCMFEKCPSVPDSYLQAVHKLSEKYRSAEFDPTIPHLEKKKLMEEWWRLSEEVLIGLNISPQEIDEVVKELKPHLRDGCIEFFEDLRHGDIPVLVFSAGLGETVVSTLKHGKILLPNVKVVANFLNYDSNGIIQGFRDKVVINIYNKNESVLRETEYYETLHDKTNVILAGDSLGDATMATGVEKANAVLKIGFLYENVEHYLKTYMDTFDIVLVDDQTMHVPHGIFKCIS